MDTAQWPQDIGLVKTMDHQHHHHQDHQMAPNSCNRAIGGGERRATRPQEQLNCPRCNSTNTKFCYYNNYSLTQPRYFCKGCRRYWTEGGSLRNVPVGGGSRKNKRPSSTSTSTPPSSSSYKLPDLNPPKPSLSSSLLQNPNLNKTHQGQDLNLSFQVTHQDHHHGGAYTQLAKMENHEPQQHDQSNTNNNNTSSSALDLLRTGIATRGLMSSLIPTPMPDSNTLYSSSSAASGGFSLHDFKPTQLGFSVDHALGSSGGRLFFPFGDHFSKQLGQANHDQDNDKDQSGAHHNPNRYWNGMMQGGGGSW